MDSNRTTQLGRIEEGKFKGKRIILAPREGLPQNVYFVEKGQFPGGGTEYSKACLVCEIFVADQGCTKCNKNNYE